MRLHILALVCVVLLLQALPAVAAQRIRIAVDVPYPPFADKDPASGKLFGFDVEIGEAICKQLALDCEIVAVPFDEIIPGILAGTLEVGIAGMAITPEREQQVLFSDKYFRSSSLYIEIPGSVAISREGLKGKRIAVQNDTIQHAYLRETYADIATIVPMQNFEDIARATLNKKVDVALVEGLPAYHKLKQEAWMGLDLVGDPVSFNKNSHIIVSKALPELVQAINRAIHDIRANGEYDRINRKYFEFNIY